MSLFRLGFRGIVLGALLLASTGVAQSPVESALAHFLAKDPRTIASELEGARPPAVTPTFKMRILNSLPAKGEVQKLKPRARAKLVSVKQILRSHQHESVYEKKVISVPQAFVGLHARAVILISETALNLLDTEELRMKSVTSRCGRRIR